MKLLWSAGEYILGGISTIIGTLVPKSHICGAGGRMPRHRREGRSVAVSYPPDEVCASYYADAEQSQLRRAILAKWLAWVNGTCVFREMAPVAATWALATVEPSYGASINQKENAAAGLNRRLWGALMAAAT